MLSENKFKSYKQDLDSIQKEFHYSLKEIYSTFQELIDNNSTQKDFICNSTINFMYCNFESSVQTLISDYCTSIYKIYIYEFKYPFEKFPNFIRKKYQEKLLRIALDKKGYLDFSIDEVIDNLYKLHNSDFSNLTLHSEIFGQHSNNFRLNTIMELFRNIDICDVTNKINKKFHNTHQNNILDNFLQDIDNNSMEYANIKEKFEFKNNNLLEQMLNTFITERNNASHSKINDQNSHDNEEIKQYYILLNLLIWIFTNILIDELQENLTKIIINDYIEEIEIVLHNDHKVHGNQYIKLNCQYKDLDKYSMNYIVLEKKQRQEKVIKKCSMEFDNQELIIHLSDKDSENNLNKKLNKCYLIQTKDSEI